MKKDEALKKAMYALHHAAWDLMDPKDLEKNMKNETLKQIHETIQLIKKVLEDQES